MQFSSLQCRHNERDGVSDHWLRDCLQKRLFGHIPKKTSKLCVTGVCEGNPPRVMRKTSSAIMDKMILTGEVDCPTSDLPNLPSMQWPSNNLYQLDILQWNTNKWEKMSKAIWGTYGFFKMFQDCKVSNYKGSNIHINLISNYLHWERYVAN